MITCSRFVAAVVGVLLLVRGVEGHPGSGIVVTAEGVVYFVDNSPPAPEGSGREIVWKLEKNGKLTASERGGGHWLALDAGGAFAGVDFAEWFRERKAPNFQTVTPLATFGPSLVACDGQPFVFGRDGNLYYARGNLELARLTPEGKVSVVAPGMLADADRRGGIKGIASGPDGSIYLSYPGAVQKVSGDGRTSVVAENIKLEGAGAGARTDLRGLAVDEKGVVYAADSGGRRVIKIAPDGKVTTVLKAEGWIPTGVAVGGGDVYVLEFDDAPPTVWRPRVRKLTTDGKITVLAEIASRV
jgi:sugar lactone lactonase YvrE